MKLVLALLGLFLLAVPAFPVTKPSRTVSYEGHQVLRCGISSENAKLFRHIEEELLLDVWGVRNSHVDVRVSPQQKKVFLAHFNQSCEVLIENVETLIKQEENYLSQPTADWFQAYHTYADIINWYKVIAANYSKIAILNPSIGKSVEGRDQPALHITSSSSSTKPKIYWQCQIHAREWISGAVCMYIVNYLVSNYQKNATVTALIDDLEFVIVPFVNPDGYSYTWTNERLWRKNREKNQGSTCFGVDLNRNYNDHWGQGGSSSNPCSDTYKGASAASEPEVQNTQNYFKSISPVIGGIDWHSYSQLILRPYGWTNANSPDETVLKALGDTMAAKTYQINKVQYTSEKSIDLYVTTGTASDWFYGDEATKTNGGYRAAGFTIELRDTGRYGFLLPPDQIIPNGEEMIAASMYFADFLRQNPLHVK